MNNKEVKFNWSDVEVHLLGQKIDVVPIQYDKTELLQTNFEFEGNINITKHEFQALIRPNNVKRKLTNFQWKKLWKKYLRNLENNK